MAGQISSGREPTVPGEVPSPALPLQMQEGGDLATAPPMEKWTVEHLRSALLESVKHKEQSYGEAVDSLITEDEVDKLLAHPEVRERDGGVFFRVSLFQADVSALSVPGVDAAALKTALVSARCDPERFRLNVTAVGYCNKRSDWLVGVTLRGVARSGHCWGHIGILFEFRGHRQNGSGLERIFNVKYPHGRNEFPFVKDVLEHLNQCVGHQAGVQLPVSSHEQWMQRFVARPCVLRVDDEDYDNGHHGPTDNRDEHARAVGELIQKRAREAVEIWYKNDSGGATSSSGQQPDGVWGTTRPVITFDFEDMATHGQFLHRLRTYHLLACWDHQNEAYGMGIERNDVEEFHRNFERIQFEPINFGRRWLRIVKRNDDPDVFSAQLTPQQRQDYEDVEKYFLNQAVLELRETEEERVVKDDENLVVLSRVQAAAAGGGGGEIRTDSGAGNETELKLELRVTFPHWAV